MPLGGELEVVTGPSQSLSYGPLSLLRANDWIPLLA
jgi:hypothetical protein